MNTMPETQQSAQQFDMQSHQHQRYNPLTDQWVLVCPRRIERPGASPETPTRQPSTVQKAPGNNALLPLAVRSNGERNPDYKATFVFTNDHPALEPASALVDDDDEPLLRVAGANGTCRVICYHPDPVAALATMSIGSVEAVVREWIKQYTDLSKQFKWIQIFENRGEASTNPHPHCQLWACDFLPSRAAKADSSQLAYFQHNGRPLLVDYLLMEVRKRHRIVIESTHFVVVVPFWALWPLETLLLPRRHVTSMTELDEDETIDLARVVQRLVIKYDNLYQCAFPYSMGWHQAPNSGGTSQRHWQLHAMYCPPLIAANRRKYMGGFEQFAQGMRDFTAERAADMLRQASDTEHYSKTVENC